MGLHTGEPPRSRVTRYLGIDVSRAAGSARPAHGGQILLSQTTRELWPGRPKSGILVLPLAGLPAPERIYQLLVAGSAAPTFRRFGLQAVSLAGSGQMP